MSNDQQQQAAALIAERRGTVRRIISLDGVVVAALLGRKNPQVVEKLQTEILKLRARVRSLDQQIGQSSDAA